MKRLALCLLLLTGCAAPDDYDGLRVVVDAERYPQAARVILAAQKEGLGGICTLDREGSSERRSDALNGHRIEEGYNRMQYPFATCIEGGDVAHVESISKKESRSFGGWWGSQIRELPDGTTIKIEVRK